MRTLILIAAVLVLGGTFIADAADEAVAPATAPGPNQKTVDGTIVFLGIMPKGGDLYHLNITLRDARTNAVIGDAQVKVELNATVSYGNDFHLTGKEPHVITVQIRRPQSAHMIEARFDYKG